MRQELDEQLCAEFPLIFKNRHGDMRETAMCWGFACGDGWYPLIRHLCLRLTRKLRVEQQSYDFYAAMTPEKLASSAEWIRIGASSEQQAARLAKIEQLAAQVPVASQVKEKFGTLRFYVEACTPEDQALISAAEAMSAIVCEQCGMTTGTKTYTTGWHKTLCPSCATAVGYIDETTPNDD